jgi:hypothetical protein
MTDRQFKWNPISQQVEGADCLERLAIWWRHTAGGHPMFACHRKSLGGNLEAHNICFVCGLEAGLPLASLAQKYELLSAPGKAPVRVRPVRLPEEKISLLKLWFRWQQWRKWVGPVRHVAQVTSLAVVGSALLGVSLHASWYGPLCLVNGIIILGWGICSFRTWRAHRTWQKEEARQISLAQQRAQRAAPFRAAMEQELAELATTSSDQR